MSRSPPPKKACTDGPRYSWTFYLRIRLFKLEKNGQKRQFSFFHFEAYLSFVLVNYENEFENFV
jgi:hypothetical protein